jgi:hypothetical protein
MYIGLILKVHFLGKGALCLLGWDYDRLDKATGGSQDVEDRANRHIYYRDREIGHTLQRRTVGWTVYEYEYLIEKHV